MYETSLLDAQFSPYESTPRLEYVDTLNQAEQFDGNNASNDLKRVAVRVEDEEKPCSAYSKRMKKVAHGLAAIFSITMVLASTIECAFHLSGVIELSPDGSVNAVALCVVSCIASVYTLKKARAV